MTDAEKLLWSRLRRKQVCQIQFYRQKPLGNYIVDFFAPSANLVIEIDGSQHFEKNHRVRDKLRDTYLTNQGLKVLRFDNRQVLLTIDSVMEVIFRALGGYE